uniref:Palmitoyl-protein thioesterase 1 n=1 Tax=Globisporangium ultimum (strain ATCC 200006 / CBS 805.95 / DAOM BR144) TaxID=431595 RepID=K3WY29_GLOUD
MEQEKGSKLPIFFFHGLGANASEAGKFQANLTAEGRVFHALSFCPDECSFGPLQYQVQLAIADILSITSKNKTAYAAGYIFVGMSQGVLIARAVVEEWDAHNAKALVSLAGPQNGLFYGPQPSDFASLSILANIYGPLVINPSLFSFAGYSYADYFGKLQRAMSEAFIKSSIQNTMAIIDIIYYPVKTPWLQGNPFFAIANNINSCTPSDKDCAKAKQRRRSNFLKLHAAHFFGSPQDDFIAPWQSSILGHYTDVGTTEQIETSFSSFKVLTMQQTPEYKQDTYGLKTLAARGGIFLHEAPNVGHSCWIHDYTTFDGKLDCKFQPVYDQYVYPVLRFPFCG